MEHVFFFKSTFRSVNYILNGGVLTSKIPIFALQLVKQKTRTSIFWKMKYRFLLLLLISFSLSANSQTDNPKFDKLLADSLGGDDYGMKLYILVILKTGPNKIEDKKVSDSLFKGHMDNISSLAASGKLAVAGPLGKNNKTYRGIFILNVKTIEEAKVLLESDPTIKEKVLEAEIFEWYGSAALPTYLPNHKKIEKKRM